MRYEVIIGIEVHVELKTDTKLFCGCANSFGADVNTNTCPVCLGMPGVLPVINRQAVDMAVRAGLALNCDVHARSKFDRKQYFYPDLPKAYQISQYDQPLAEWGYVEIASDPPRRVTIRRIHMEEDAGKLNHMGQRLGDATGSMVDLNRAGVPLIEIVSEPDMHSADDVRLYLTELRTVLGHLDVSDLRMEEGSMRCDVNISLRPEGFTGNLEELNRAEIKNVNSIRNVGRAIEYEITRQRALLDDGERVAMETRGFDDATGRTYSQRSKEAANDYRYFPEPDLPPLVLTDEYLRTRRETLPISPGQLRSEIIALDIPLKDAELIVQDPAMYRYWRKGQESRTDIRIFTNWMLADLSRLINIYGHDFTSVKVLAPSLVELITLINEGTLSGRMAKDVLEKMYESGQDANAVVKALGVSQITDQGAIEAVVDAVIAAHANVVEDFYSGKDKALGFLVGQVMKQTKGQAKPDLVNRILREKLGSRA